MQIMYILLFSSLLYAPIIVGYVSKFDSVLSIQY